MGNDIITESARIIGAHIYPSIEEFYAAAPREERRKSDEWHFVGPVGDRIVWIENTGEIIYITPSEEVIAVGVVDQGSDFIAFISEWWGEGCSPEPLGIIIPRES